MLEFGIKTYFVNTFLYPLGMLLLACYIFYICVKLLRNFKYDNNPRIFRVALLVVFSLCIYTLVSLSLSRARFSIILDLVSNPVEITAEIEYVEIQKAEMGYHYDGNQVQPEIITIEGNKYYIVTTDSIGKGDTVQITYLKHSKCITSIREIEQHNPIK